MSRYIFVKTRLGFEAGRVIDDSSLREGIIKTLLDCKAIEIVADELDSKKNVKSSVSSGDAGRGKGASKGKRVSTKRSDNEAD